MKITKLTINGNDYALLGAERDAHEIFTKQPYRHLSVNGKAVHDVGSSVGDTAVYFIARGAKVVYGYESDKQRHMLAEKNKAFNGLDGFFPINVEVKHLGMLHIAHMNPVLKMDIEGGEYDVILKADKDELRRFEQIILEFHHGDEKLKAHLESAGFEVRITHRSMLAPHFGVLYAVRK